MSKPKTCISEYGSFEYSSSTINKLIEQYNLKSVAMLGVRGDLVRLKENIEKFYNDYVFYLSYWESEAPFHGWEWSKDDGTMKNMAEITDGITQKFLEAYALILSGLNMKFKDIDDETFDLVENGKEV